MIELFSEDEIFESITYFIKRFDDIKTSPHLDKALLSDDELYEIALDQTLDQVLINGQKSSELFNIYYNKLLQKRAIIRTEIYNLHQKLEVFLLNFDLRRHHPCDIRKRFFVLKKSLNIYNLLKQEYRQALYSIPVFKDHMLILENNKIKITDKVLKYNSNDSLDQILLVDQKIVQESIVGFTQILDIFFADNGYKNINENPRNELKDCRSTLSRKYINRNKLVVRNANPMSLNYKELQSKILAFCIQHIDGLDEYEDTLHQKLTAFS